MYSPKYINASTWKCDRKMQKEIINAGLISEANLSRNFTSDQVNPRHILKIVTQQNLGTMKLSFILISTLALIGNISGGM